MAIGVVLSARAGSAGAAGTGHRIGASGRPRRSAVEPTGAIRADATGPRLCRTCPVPVRDATAPSIGRLGPRRPGCSVGLPESARPVPEIGKRAFPDRPTARPRIVDVCTVGPAARPGTAIRPISTQVSAAIRPTSRSRRGSDVTGGTAVASRAAIARRRSPPCGPGRAAGTAVHRPGPWVPFNEFSSAGRFSTVLHGIYRRTAIERCQREGGRSRGGRSVPTEPLRKRCRAGARDGWFGAPSPRLPGRRGPRSVPDPWSRSAREEGDPFR